MPAAPDKQAKLTSTHEVSQRVVVDGKFFRVGGKKFYVKGITYGPFAPNSRGEMFPEAEQTARDFAQIRELAANVIRVYYVPPVWLLDLAAQHELKVFVDIPWPKHLCFLDSEEAQTNARRTVREAVAATKGHPAVFAYSVVNEISAEIVRWSGVKRVERFIDELIDEAKAVDPHCLCTFTTYPPTEFLQPHNPDFICFNVYLHKPKTFNAYLARLQTLADAKPLVLGEFGMDSIREGEEHKCEFLTWQIEGAFRGGLAGAVVFSFTDDWFRGGMQIENWGFGLTTRGRKPKESFRAVQKQFCVAPHFPLLAAPKQSEGAPRKAKVSVVVATYNGSRTLNACLESLTRLNYPDYEVIVVDDGSKDATPEIARRFPSVRYVRQENQGLSAARNTGIAAAKGEIVAFTDDDCRADEDWLYYLAGDLLRGDFVGIGGHNFLPPEDSCVAAAVLVSPGGPAHVMLTDTEAEHIPGCNMAFYKWALDEIGGFDPIYRKAGDDVDVCWRLQERNYRIGFSAAGFVWHYRRSTVKAYVKQQSGYGEAEALLIGKHPEHFNSVGGGLWRGRIYAPSNAGLLLRRAVIYHGVFGSGFFQRLYATRPFEPLMLCASLGYHTFVNVPLSLLALNYDVFVPMAVASGGISVGVCVLAAAQARLPKSKVRFWSRPLVGLLFFLQPIYRGWARFRWRLNLASSQGLTPVESSAPADGELPATTIYWSAGNVDRFRFLNGILARLDESGWRFKTDSGWTNHDVEVLPGAWVRLRLTTASEELEQNRKNFRCRIRSGWSPVAAGVFAIIAIAAISLVATLAVAMPWMWMSLLAIPLVYWLFEDERENAELVLGALIDRVATQEALVRV